jgi:hypothetical protein
MHYPYILLGFLLNNYLSRMIPIKYHLNIDCHETCHAHCIRCKVLILITCKESSVTYFELHNFKVSFVLSYYLT